MKANRLSILLLCLFCFALAARVEAWSKNESVEKYRYESVPLGDEDGPKETVDMEFIRSGPNLSYSMKTVSPEGLEKVEIETEPTGRFVSAARHSSPAGEGTMTTEKIWREGEKAYIKKGMEPGSKARSFDLPPEKSFAVDGSLLILLRGFPFGRDEAWPIYMMDFSGSSVTVTLRQTGIESVKVPAGTFECYKMDVTVEIPIFKPHIIYWVTKKQPHFLVKSIGRRGPFTRSYATSLLSIE